MKFYLQQNDENGRPAYRIYKKIDDNFVLHDEQYYRYILSSGTSPRDRVFVRTVGETIEFCRFFPTQGKMKDFRPGAYELDNYVAAAKEPKSFRARQSRGYGSRGLKKPVRLWHVSGSAEAAKASEAFRQKVAADKADEGDLEMEIVDKETLSMAQTSLTRGQSFVYLPNVESGVIKDNVLMAIPSALGSSTCVKTDVARVTVGVNPLVQKGEHLFSFTSTQAAMKDCNAFTHAVEHARETASNPKGSWEWLHIRGKQMGGDFIQTNLVAGTYHGNSSMIDFENSLTEHARFFAANATLSSYFEVTWSAECEPAKSHVGRWILIEWEVSYCTPNEQADFEANAKFKVFTKRGRFAFDARRTDDWTMFHGQHMVRYCQGLPT
ncbi:hypothetical protein NHH73_15360 [Oxalobacteraceae bacterium OTU3CINTB1]|nr:hypothetical protein NHH73_15360 [Oxalobacteraceae bacterium OTU3CINTB1]